MQEQKCCLLRNFRFTAVWTDGQTFWLNTPIKILIIRFYYPSSSFTTLNRHSHLVVEVLRDGPGVVQQVVLVKTAGPGPGVVLGLYDVVAVL